VRDRSLNISLLRTLSAERLRKYTAFADGDVHRALTLYEHNARLSEAFYIPLQCVEIAFRNALDSAMRAQYGDDWLFQKILHDDDARKIERVERNVVAAGKVPDRSIVVAELSLGFWVALVSARYDATIWRRALYRAFSVEQIVAGTTVRRTPARRAVHARFDAIRRFRNRVAHHEPVFDRDPVGMHADIIAAIDWICPDTARWTRWLSRAAPAAAPSPAEPA